MTLNDVPVSAVDADNPYLAALAQRTVVFDGATGTNLQLLNLEADDFGGAALEGCNEILTLTRPEIIANLHRSFFEVGVDVVETDSFGSFSVVLNEYGIPEKAHELAVASASIARKVADEFATPQRPRFVAGSIGPGTKFPSLGQISYDDLSASYEELAYGLLEGGVDLLIIETMYDLLSGKAAINACHRAMARHGRRVPLQAQVTIELTGRMLPGTEIGAAITSLVPMGIDVLGLNCATGPVEMYEPLRQLSDTAPLPLSCLPNAGLPSVVDGLMHYDLTPEALAQHLSRFVSEYGVAAVAVAVERRPRTSRPSSRAFETSSEPRDTPNSSRPWRRSTRQRPTTKTARYCWSVRGPTRTVPRNSAKPCSRVTGTPAWRLVATKSKKARTCWTSASTTPGPTALPTWTR